MFQVFSNVLQLPFDVLFDAVKARILDENSSMRIDKMAFKDLLKIFTICIINLSGKIDFLKDTINFEFLIIF